jgi:hypothetical protein
MKGTARRIVTRVLSTFVVIAVLAAGVFAFVYRQDLQDHLAASQFEPTAQIVELTDRIELSDRGHRIFWATHPTLDASQSFNEQCARVEHIEEGHVLGCFVDGHIHLFEVTDERLNGIIEVTAAHELLHATFSRLSNERRASLVQDLNALFEELSASDPDLKERMEVYAGLSQTAFANELHSVLGTEVRELPEWLEQHYATWLQDRDVILDFFDSYHAVFDELTRRADELQTLMTDLRADVEGRSAQYEGDVEQFNREWTDFLRRNDAFEFSDDPDEFYRVRTEFYDWRDQLGEEREQLNRDIDRYEEMRAELLKLSELNNELTNQLDSDLAPPAGVPTDV